MKNKFKVIGYSGHSFVVIESAIKSNLNCIGYYDVNKKTQNPFNINYFGKEDSINSNERLFISIGDNKIRRSVYENLKDNDFISFINIIDPTSSVSKYAKIKANSTTLIGTKAIINCFSKIDLGVIINTGAIIEHEVSVGKFSHIGPSATICGSVDIGNNVFIGANSVVKENLKIGKNSIIGAGSVVLKNVPANSIWVGNPAKDINYSNTN